MSVNISTEHLTAIKQTTTKIKRDIPCGEQGFRNHRRPALLRAFQVLAIFLIVSTFASNNLTAQISEMPNVWMNYDGHLEVFYSMSGVPYHSWQLSPAVEQNWAANDPLGGGIVGSPAVAADSGGRLEIFAEGGGGAIYYNWQITPGGAFSGWSLLTYGPVAGPPAVAENTDGTLQVFAVMNDTVYTDQQMTAGDNSDWTGWVGLSGASIATTPSTITDYSGNLYIFAQGTDSAAWYNVRSAATGAWSGWSSLGGTIFGSPSAALNLDGRVEIFVQGGGNGVFHNWQNSDLSTWNGWVSLGGAVLAPPTAVVNADGRIEIFAVGTDNGAYLWKRHAAARKSGPEWLQGAGCLRRSREWRQRKRSDRSGRFRIRSPVGLDRRQSHWHERAERATFFARCRDFPNRPYLPAIHLR